MESRKFRVFRLLCFALLFSAVAAHASGAISDTYYGSGLGSDSLANTVVGGPAGNVVSYRFRAGHSGSLKQIHVYLIQQHAGYSAGTGGQIQITVNADDGTSAHNPSSTVLASYLLSNPASATPSIYFPIFVFPVAPTLVQGQLYHIVFTNVDPNSTANYLSVDALYYANPTTPAQPTMSDVDSAELLSGPSSAWAPRKGYTPILELDYQDGFSELNGYMEVWVGVPQNISGISAVRETFTVSQAPRTVTSASVRVARTSGADPLTVRLENGDGSIIEEGQIPAASAPLTSPISYTWVTYTFSSAHTLAVGQTYSLEFDAPSTSTYQAYPIRKGNAYGFQNTTYFPDGYAQCNSSGSWVGWTQWGVSNRTDGDLQFYFALATSSAGPTISNVQAGSITSSTATISWTTDQASTSQVEYGTTTAYGNLTAVDSNNVTSHSVNLTGLVVATLYHYRVHSMNASSSETISGDLTFTTSAPALAITTASLPNAAQNVSYSALLGATGGTLPYVWSIASGALPGGLTLDAGTGTISGTPTGSGTATFTVNVSDSASASATKTLSVTVTSSLAITTSSLQGGTVSAPYSATVSASGGTAPYTWTIASGALPSGLVLSSSTGVVSGTPTGSGTATFTVNVTDSASASATKTLSVTVTSSLAISTNSLPGGIVSAPYSATLSASGGTAPYTWSVASGALPSGLALSSSTGGVSGTPTSAGTATFTVNVADSASASATKTLSVTVTASLAITTNSLPGGTVSAPYSATVSASGGTAPYTWTIASGALPSGLVLSSSTGVVSGTLTASGTATFTVNVSDSASASASKTLSVTVTSSLAITTNSLPGGTLSAPYTATVSASGGTAPYTWTIASGALPTGLLLSSSTGTISGTPTGSGTTTFAVKVTDSASASATKTFSVTLTSSLVISTIALPSGTQSVPYSASVNATGGTAPYTWSITSGALPSGLILSSGTGAISGTPTGSGTASFTVKVTDSASASATKALSLTVTSSLVITTNSLPGGTLSAPYSATVSASGGTAPYTWSIASGALPSGLILSSSTGAISGTPSASGTGSFTVQVSDASSLVASKPLSIAIAAPAAIALKQSNAAQGWATHQVSVSFPSSNTAGNLILAFVRMSTTYETVTVTDSARNTYVEAVAQTQSSDGSQIHLFYAKNVRAGSNTVTATFSSTNNHSWLATFEYAGLNASNPLDRTASSQGRSTIASSGVTSSTSSPTELIFAGFGLPVGYFGSQSQGAGFTLLRNDQGASPAATESALVTATGSFGATFNLSSTVNWSGIIATFRP